MTGRHTLLIAVAAGSVAFLIATTVISCGGWNGATPTAPTSVTTRTVTNVAVDVLDSGGDSHGDGEGDLQ